MTNARDEAFRKVLKKVTQQLKEPYYAYMVFILSADRLANMDDTEMRQIVKTILEPDVGESESWSNVVAGELNWLADAEKAARRLEALVLDAGVVPQPADAAGQNSPKAVTKREHPA